jgi:hypothetical protein
VANQGALWNNPLAHNYVRLYFRPRNNYHLKTEGIKSASDGYRSNPPMTIPVMFAFDFIQTIILPDAFFLPENFAVVQAPLDGDAAFNQFDFQKIYHDGPTNDANRQEIHRARMAEVVVRHSLPLQTLRAVVCRSPYEERTLRYYLRDFDNLPPIITERNGNVFFRRGIYIEQMYLQEGHVVLSFRHPTRSAQELYSLSIAHQGVVRQYSLAAGKAWRFPQFEASEDDVIRVEIEGCLAFEGPLRSDQSEIA